MNDVALEKVEEIRRRWERAAGSYPLPLFANCLNDRCDIVEHLEDGRLRIVWADLPKTMGVAMMAAPTDVAALLEVIEELEAQVFRFQDVRLHQEKG